MEWKEIANLITEVLGKIKFNILNNNKLADTINIGGKQTNYHINFPKDMDPKLFADMVFKPELENLTVKNTTKELKEKHPDLPNLPEAERFQLITDCTSASISGIMDISDNINISEFSKVELDFPGAVANNDDDEST